MADVYVEASTYTFFQRLQNYKDNKSYLNIWIYIPLNCLCANSIPGSVLVVRQDLYTLVIILLLPFSKYKLYCFVPKQLYTHQENHFRVVIVNSPSSFSSRPCHTGFPVLFTNPIFFPTYT